MNRPIENQTAYPESIIFGKIDKNGIEEVTCVQKKIKEDIVERTTQIFKLLGDPTRFRMLYLLEEEWNVNAIALELNMEQSAVSHQLKKLKQAKLVKSRRVGKNMLYSQDDSHVFEILEMAVTHATHTTHPEK
ncbi:metalloregulator ArsR/SmtB family transcription factor [Jeotgalibaca sp. MA1X17-3]|uniref:ArsR/SmtB family transcription factor n=1 Tax=Jeotgalibaca sp. MA1X17-3 TaxID=2908211 RepID=UPI0028830EDE|nr:metalloregulator ArsR/SmtB family transcription factor [Jeotgalibaca sp. MA1X17-3]